MTERGCEERKAHDNRSRSRYSEPSPEFGSGGATVRDGVMSEPTVDWRRQMCVADLCAVLGGKKPHTEPAWEEMR